MKLKVFLIVLICLICLIRGAVLAEESSDAICSSDQDCATKKAEVEKRLGEITGELETYSSNISYLNNQIRYSNLKISESRLKITEMEGNIASLSAKIERLNEALDSLENLLGKRVETAYKDNRWKIWEVLAGKQGLTEKIRSLAYLRSAQMHDRQLLLQMRDTKANYNEQKNTLENLKKNLELEKKRLENLKATMAEQKKQVELLLKMKEEEKIVYQEKLNKIREQKAKLLGGISALIGNQPGQFKEWSGDNHYFNQADSRWANKLIGGFYDARDPSYMWKYGCAVASTAMVLHNLGIDTDAGRLSQSSIYYADLIAWQNVSGNFPVKMTNSAYGGWPGWAAIDNYLNGGKWVIVHVRANTIYGHYVVLQKKEGDDYIMHDPYFGPNLKFSEGYSKGMADQAIVYERN